MPAPTPLRLALLDLDHTLLAADSNQLWMSHLLGHGLICVTDVAAHDAYVDDYAHGRLDFAALQAFRHRIDASIAPEPLRRHRERFDATELLPAIAADAPALVAQLQAQGFETLVVSATRETLVWPVARALGIGHVIGADSNLGVGWPCVGAGKVHNVEDWLTRRGQSLAGLAESRFYSDSHNDLPLLEAVDRPCAVDPDPVLARVAAARGWPVLSLRGAAVTAA